MASTQQQAIQQCPFGIEAGGVYGGVPPISDPRARAAMQHQPLGSQFRLGHPAPMQPQKPQVSRAAGFQHERNLDEDTGELLPKHLIRTANQDELNYFNSKV